MITNSELTAVEFSPTKKDFYQIWNEIIELAGKISERWDPSSTNESDPGIVLLKVLTAVADKLNFTIDANTLEAFMPSAAQEESMRKLTEMMGYNMKYYQSATVDVKVSYIETGHEVIPSVIRIDKFTNIKDIDGNINYVTQEETYLDKINTSKVIPCIEGELVECETDNDNIISLLQLDDKNRYYLPEIQIAENGIFITNITDNIESSDWKKVDNLNTQGVGTRCYKFGFDSRENLPYIQFPNDIGVLIEDGIKIKYLRTNGVNGNISANTLCKMEAPASWSFATSTSTAAENSADYYTVENYSITNINASTDGRNTELLNDAYDNFKKTIGTFDTLVTCRDYMNKIYQMTVKDTSATNLVSNVIVSDINSDINKSMTMCTFNIRGPEYKSMSKPLDIKNAIQITKEQFDALPTPTESDLGKVYKVVDTTDQTTILFYARCIYNGSSFEYIKLGTTELSHFDLLIYPFAKIYGLNNKSEYVNSFKYSDDTLNEILDNLEENKTLSHNIRNPEKDDIACIKNYLRLRAKITTVRKVNTIEQADILNAVYASLFEHFNMRKLDFGEEIPYDTILAVLKEADPRIKNVSLEEPELLTKFCTVSGAEFETSSNLETPDRDALHLAGDKYYNQLALNNVLAGRVPLFNYDKNFTSSYTEAVYPSWIDESTGDYASYNLIYPVDDEADKIYKLKSEFNITAGAKDVKLNDNEVIQFRLPNLKTVKTYPAYVNYYIKLNTETVEPTIPATFQTLLQFMENCGNAEATINAAHSWEALINENGIKNVVTQFTNGTITDPSSFDTQKAEKHAIFTLGQDNNYKYEATWNPEWSSALPDFYYPDASQEKIAIWREWIATKTNNLVERENGDVPTTTSIKRDNGLFIVVNQEMSRDCGYLVDQMHIKYKPLDRIVSISGDPFTYYYVQRLWASTKDGKSSDSSIGSTDPEYCHTANGLGQDGSFAGISADEDYELKEGEYLLFNYTSSTSTDGAEIKTQMNEYYGATTGTIIRPSFDLIDSEVYRKNHSWNKTTGFNFRDYLSEGPAGLFTLGTNQQIEIREYVDVSLDEMSTNIYWIRNEEIPNAYNDIVFEFDEEPIYKKSGDGYTAGDPYRGSTAEGENDLWMYSAYTLKEGEYFYYTDKNKTDLAYYGSGSKIKVTHNTPKIYKPNVSSAITANDIASKGLTASINWKVYDFSKSGGIDKHVTITEYQYVNLVKDNILNTITQTGERDNNSASIIDCNITNNWQDIAGAQYTISELDNKTTSLPAVNLRDIHWQVRSKLEFNMSPYTVQTLHAEKSKFGAPVWDSITLTTYDTTTTPLHPYYRDFETLTPHNNEPLSIKANKIVLSNASNISVTTKEFADDGHLIKEEADLKLKIVSLEEVVNNQNDTVTLNNFSDNYTKVNFNNSLDTESSTSTTTLNAIIPDSSKYFGLIMFYATKSTPDGDSIALKFIPSTAPADPTIETIATPEIYNYKKENQTWWFDETSDKMNPGGFGKVANHDIWAIESGVFKNNLTQDEFEALKSTGNIFERIQLTTPETKPSPEAYHRYDYNENFYYQYVNAANQYWDPTQTPKKVYGSLSHIGGTTAFYHLRAGLNIVKVSESCKIEIYAGTGSGAKEDTVIFGPLDLVNTPKSINEKIAYKSISSGYSIEQQILEDISKLDLYHEFYYNNISDNSLLIDMNEEDKDDNLELPTNWYNANNINNKFVISELMVDSLKNYVVIAKSSKL